MVARQKIKPTMDIKTQIAIAKYEQFAKDPSAKRQRKSKNVPRQLDMPNSL